jgi:hypothetical protein
MKTRRTKAQRVAMQIERIPMHYRRMCQAEYKIRMIAAAYCAEMLPKLERVSDAVQVAMSHMLSIWKRAQNNEQ